MNSPENSTFVSTPGKTEENRLRVIYKQLAKGLITLTFTITGTINSSAQLCDGSLGDPVVRLDFGSGTSTHGTALGIDITSYSWTTADFPSDGYYTIESRTNTANTWWTTTDHTGGGYMMVVNASFSVTDYFYRNTVKDLCPNTTYEFAAWIMNLLRYSDTSTPNITFTIETTDGSILRSYSTGDIPMQSTAKWKQYGFFFTTPNDISEVVIRMRNNKAGAAPGNDIALDDITFRPCGPEISATIANTTAITKEICEGDTTTYTLTGKIESGFEDAAYQWQISYDNGSNWSDIAGAEGTEVHCQLSLPGTYTYRILTARGSNINSVNCRVASNVITIIVNENPGPEASSNNPSCNGDLLQLTAESGGISYTWTGPDGFSSNLRNPAVGQITSAANGYYRVTMVSSGLCTGIDSVYIEVNEKPRADAGEDVSICEGTTTLLNGSGGNIYSWSPGITLSDSAAAAPVAAPTDSTLFVLTVKNGECADQDSVMVNVWKRPFADAGNDLKIYEGSVVKLSGKASGTGVTWYWTPDENISETGVLSPEVSPVADATYTLHVQSPFGCGESTDVVFVRVYKKVTVPNVFSPNGDGINDTWRITNLITYPESRMIVFNRYGQVVYCSSGYNDEWDGTISGSPLPVGTYFFEIDLQTGLENPSGWIAILR